MLSQWVKYGYLVHHTREMKRTAANSYDVTVMDIGATVNVGNLALTGYFYSGEGAGTTFLGNLGATGGQERDSDGGYLQATYVDTIRH